MKNRIIELLKEDPYSVKELYELLNKDFDLVTLTKTVNSLIDEGQIFEIDGVNYLTSNFYIGKVSYKRGYIYVEDFYEVKNADNHSLYDKDEIVYTFEKNKAVCLKVLKRNNIYVLGKITYRHGKPYFFSDEIKFANYNVVNLKEYSNKVKPNYRVRCFISDYFKKELKIDTILGPEDKEKVLIDTILLMNNAPKEFNKDVLEELEKIDENVEVNNRRDLRDLSFITIDSDEAKDFDDAIYVEKNDGGYKLYVSIADVSYYVKKGSVLDKSALKRGTSIYYPEHVIPMLPFKLSDNLCSLMEGVDRYTLTCEMNIGFDGLITTYDIYPSVIRSKHRMTYKNVNKILEHDKDVLDKYSDIIQMIYNSYELSRIVGNVRTSKGGIEFDSNEPIILRDNGKVIGITNRIQGKAEKLIEDFMIIANETVASHMYYLDLPLIYRNHTYPKEDKILKFINIAESFGYTFKGNKFELKSKELRKCLDYFYNTDNYSLISDLMLRSMSKAVYESTSDIHYGLGLDHYCHFTSPIRRYPDLIVHRMLWKYCFNMNNKDIESDNKENITISNKCNEAERRATTIERSIVDLMKCEYMKDSVGGVYFATISSIQSYGMYVRLDNTVEGLVHVSTMDDMYYLDDNENLTNGETVYSIGQKVKVKLTNVDLIRRNIDFELVKKQKFKMY